jgi:hypothetical protein
MATAGTQVLVPYESLKRKYKPEEKRVPRPPNPWNAEAELLGTLKQMTTKQDLRACVEEKRVTPGENVPWAVALYVAIREGHMDVLQEWNTNGWISASMAVVWNNFLFASCCFANNLVLAKWWFATFDILNHHEPFMYEDVQEGVLVPTKPAHDEWYSCFMVPDTPVYGKSDSYCDTVLPGGWERSDPDQALPRDPKSLYPIFYDTCVNCNLECAQWLWGLMKLPQEKANAKLRYIFAYICHRTNSLARQKATLAWLTTLFDPTTVTVDGAPEGYTSAGGEKPSCRVAFEKAAENRFFGLAAYLLEMFPVLRGSYPKVAKDVGLHEKDCERCIKDTCCYVQPLLIFSTPGLIVNPMHTDAKALEEVVTRKMASQQAEMTKKNESIPLDLRFRVETKVREEANHFACCVAAHGYRNGHSWFAVNARAWWECSRVLRDWNPSVQWTESHSPAWFPTFDD